MRKDTGEIHLTTFTGVVVGLKSYLVTLSQADYVYGYTDSEDHYIIRIEWKDRVMEREVTEEELHSHSSTELLLDISREWRNYRDERE